MNANKSSTSNIEGKVKSVHEDQLEGLIGNLIEVTNNIEHSVSYLESRLEKVSIRPGPSPVDGSAEAREEMSQIGNRIFDITRNLEGMRQRIADMANHLAI